MRVCCSAGLAWSFKSPLKPCFNLHDVVLWDVHCFSISFRWLFSVLFLCSLMPSCFHCRVFFVFGLFFKALCLVGSNELCSSAAGTFCLMVKQHILQSSDRNTICLWLMGRRWLPKPAPNSFVFLASQLVANSCSGSAGSAQPMTAHREIPLCVS